MSDLTAKFDAFKTQVEDQHASLMVLLGEMAATLGNVEIATDLLINNGATNTRALLNAITANGGCVPCTTPPLVVPPLVTGENPVNSDKCKRTQAFLDAMEQIYTIMDLVSGFGIGWSPTLITDAYSQVIAGFASGDTPDAPSWPEASQIVGDAVNYGIGNFLVGDTLSTYFASVKSAAQSAIYAASDVSGDKAAYAGVIASSAIPDYAQPLMIDLAYSALWNYYFDPTSTPNLAGYSGIVCVPAECFTLDSDGAFELFISIDYMGWRVTGFDDGCCTDLWTSNVTRARRWTSEAIDETLGATTANDPPAYTNHHGLGYYFGRGCCNTPFSLTVCPPE